MHALYSDIYIYITKLLQKTSIICFQFLFEKLKLIIDISVYIYSVTQQCIYIYIYIYILLYSK